MIKTVSCWKLGKEGRFGNSLSIYCWLKGYARSIGAELRVPSDWVGRKIFTIPEGSIDSAPPSTRDLDKDMKEKWEGITGDLFSFGQHQRFIDFYSRTDAKRWLKIRPEWMDYEKELMNEFPPSYSVAHLRRGDYTRPPAFYRYCCVTEKSYKDAIAKFGIPEPILWVQDGWRKSKIEASDIGPFFDDFLITKNAKNLLRSNSTFAWWAAVLGNAKVYSPVVGKKVGWSDCEFLEANWPQTAQFDNQSDLRLRE